jgi:hypothetical protein
MGFNKFKCCNTEKPTPTTANIHPTIQVTQSTQSTAPEEYDWAKFMLFRSLQNPIVAAWNIVILLGLTAHVCSSKPRYKKKEDNPFSFSIDINKSRIYKNSSPSLDNIDLKTKKLND